MYSSIDTSLISKPGDFTLSDVILTSYRSESGGNKSFKISIKTIVTDINIYESIFNKTLSGDITLIDAQNVVSALPLTGFERLEFKLFTPSISRGFDFTEKTGHPMYIYRIGNRQSLNPRTQIYTLYFASKEMIQNEKVKAIKAYQGQISNIVTEIVRDSDLLDSQKDIFVEDTKGIHKYVAPIEKPIDFLDMLSKDARSNKFHNPGMLFYETSFGFNFRSIESMLAITDSKVRPVVARFEPKPASIRDNGNRDIIQEMKIASQYRIKDQFNTLKNLRNGIYASLTTKYDSFFKTIEDIIFDYHKDYEKGHHTEHDRDGGKTDNKGIAPLLNEKGNLISNYFLGTQYLRSDTSHTHNEIEIPPTSEITPKRLSYNLAFESFKLELTVPGFTGLSAGELISFEMPTHAPVSDIKPDIDPYMSGRYLISSVRHNVSSVTKKHSMILECIKDSVRSAYPEENIDTFTGKEAAARGVIDIYTLDEVTVSGSSNPNTIFKS